ncbi:MAG: virulence protein RhuM/Fic/DOC family protein [Lentisphaerae bacterium]|nr:virulence protein RhuM/Fic/DOC family protein [Lentisphaerota bacterium]
MTTANNRTEIKATGGDIVLYRTKDGRVAVDVRLEKETIWLAQKDMAVLFAAERSVITKHLNNIFQSGELQRGSNVQKMHIAGSDKPVAFYSLDAIIAVGYRVNSRRGTEFRIWATGILKDHILKGYTLNEKRLQDQVVRLSELQAAVDIMGRILSKKAIGGTEAEGLLRVIADYSLALRLLDLYDLQQLSLHGTTGIGRFVITYEAAMPAIARMAKTMGPLADGLFGHEKDKGLASAIGAIYQTFSGHDLYPSIEEKAAHLLYFVVKNHAFVDGNKRIGAFLFIWFLDGNGLLYRKDGTKRLADNALVALTLLIAESKPAEKDTICKVIVNLINRENL